MSIYVYFKRNMQLGIHLPNFETSLEEPQVAEDLKRRVHALDDDECIYGGRFSFSDDQTYIHCNHWRISNIGGKIVEELLESYTMPGYGK